MTPLRIITALAALVAGSCLVFISVDNLAGNELARFALTCIISMAVFGSGLYLLGAGVVLLTHETWIARVVERMKQ